MTPWELAVEEYETRMELAKEVLEWRLFFEIKEEYVALCKVRNHSRQPK